MKTLKFLYLTLICVLMSACNASKDSSKKDTLLQDNSEVNLIEKVVFQKWVGGLEATGSGYHMGIYPAKTGRTLNLKRIYFRNLEADIKIGKITYVASLKSLPKKDIQLSSNPEDEHKNTLPESKEFPFLLNDNECVVSYVSNDTIKFIKVNMVKEKEAVYYPSARPKN